MPTPKCTNPGPSSLLKGASPVTALAALAGLAAMVAPGCATSRSTNRQLAEEHAGSGEAGRDVTQFHLNAERLGWKSSETTLKPANVTQATFGKAWESPVFESVLADDQNGHLVRDAQGKP